MLYFLFLYIKKFPNLAKIAVKIMFKHPLISVEPHETPSLLSDVENINILVDNIKKKKGYS